jgi:hypothetical protein
VPAFLAEADGLILEELNRAIAYGTRDFIYCPGLPIAAVLAWTSHEISPLLPLLGPIYCIENFKNLSPQSTQRTQS